MNTKVLKYAYTFNTNSFLTYNAFYHCNRLLLFLTIIQDLWFLDKYIHVFNQFLASLFNRLRYQSYFTFNVCFLKYKPRLINFFKM